MAAIGLNTIQNCSSCGSMPNISLIGIELPCPVDTPGGCLLAQRIFQILSGSVLVALISCDPWSRFLHLKWRFVSSLVSLVKVEFVHVILGQWVLVAKHGSWKPRRQRDFTSIIHQMISLCSIDHPYLISIKSFVQNQIISL